MRGVGWGGLEGCKSSRVASIQSGFSPLTIMHGIRGQDPVCLIARTNRITLRESAGRMLFCFCIESVPAGF